MNWGSGPIQRGEGAAMAFVCLALGVQPRFKGLESQRKASGMLWLKIRRVEFSSEVHC